MKIDIQKIKKQLGLSKRPAVDSPREAPVYEVRHLSALLPDIRGDCPVDIQSDRKGKSGGGEREGIQYRDPVSRREPYGRQQGQRLRAGSLVEEERGRKDTFLEMSELFNRNKDRKDTVPSVDSGVNLELPSVPETVQTHNPVRSSTSAYHDMNRSLTTIYTPRETSREEELLRRIEELEKRQNMEPSGRNSHWRKKWH